MVKTVLQIDGMACGMCEAHVNEAVRNACKVKKVISSHAKKQTVILSESEIDEQVVRKAIEQTGYRVLSVEQQPYEKKGRFSLFKK